MAPPKTGVSKVRNIVLSSLYSATRITKQWHPLHIAAERGHLKLCKQIVEKTGDKNPKGPHGCTPFHIATQNGHTEVCLFFIEIVEDKKSLFSGDGRIDSK